MGPFGVQEMMVIFILALLLFGPKKLPELARMLGKGLSEFRRAKNELKSTFDTHMQELERESRLDEAKKNPSAALPATTYSPYAYAADEYGKLPSDYGYNALESGEPSEPPVKAHAPVEAPPPQTPASLVPGVVPRGKSWADSLEHSNNGKDEHPA